jgi:hypothetical protein
MRTTRNVGVESGGAGEVAAVEGGRNVDQIPAGAGGVDEAENFPVVIPAVVPDEVTVDVERAGGVARADRGPVVDRCRADRARAGDRSAVADADRAVGDRAGDSECAVGDGGRAAVAADAGQDLECPRRPDVAERVDRPAAKEGEVCR